MSDRAALLSEAYRRGILPPDMRATYEEAQRRGLVGGAPGPEVQSGSTGDPGDSVEEARRRAEQLGWAQQAASRSPWGSPPPQGMAAVPRKGPSGAIEMDFPQPQPEPYFTAERGKSAASSVKRVLIDDIVQERNAFARGLMRDVKARREQRKAAQPERR